MSMPRSTPAASVAQPVDVPVVCVLTRFRMRTPLQLLATYGDFCRIRDDAARTTPGLLRSVFLVEGPRTAFSLSIWSDGEDLPVFGTEVPRHVTAVRRAFGRFAMTAGARPELWSTTWRLRTASTNLAWGDADLRDVLLSALARGGAA